METLDKYYVSLDCLLDTRLATIYKINPDLGDAILVSGKYYDRFHDQFEHFIDINQETYNQEYGYRDKDTLKLAKTTLIYKLINNELTGPFYKYMQGMTDAPPLVEVNVFPYEFDKEEKKELEAILANILLTPEIKVIRINPEKLPPWEMSKNYCHAWLYSFDEYMLPFYKEIEKHPGVQTVMHFAAISNGKNPHLATDEEIVDGFTRLQEGLAGFLTIDFSPVFNYSFHLHTTDIKGEYPSLESKIKDEETLASEVEEECRDLSGSEL